MGVIQNRANKRQHQEHTSEENIVKRMKIFDFCYLNLATGILKFIPKLGVGGVFYGAKSCCTKFIASYLQ